jgi:glyoxylase-like metal-dependent hydrolase (beta-lactamase superfamily II)
MTLTTWHIGRIRITQLVETDAGSVIQQVIPNAVPEAIKQIEWLRPNFADSSGNLKAVVQTFIVETPEHRIVVDTCVGNHKKRNELADWDNLNTDYLRRFDQIGYGTDSVDFVLCTHLHFDHVGWNTKLENDCWVPTFERARYLFAQAEFEYWKGHPSAEIEDDHAGFADSVLPVFAAGLADLVPTNHTVAPGVTLIPTPGHTPAHVSVLVSDGDEAAVITGDAMHHPCQIAYPDWETISDTNKEVARASRRALLERFADTQTLIIGSHFALPTAGRLRRDGAAYRLVV